MIPACTDPSTGRLLVFTGAPSGSRYLQGIRIDTDSERACAVANTQPATWVNGIPVDAIGQFCYEVAAPSNWGQSAIPFGPNGLVACDPVNPPNQFTNGIGFFNGRMCIQATAVLAPPGAFNLSGAAVLGQNNISWTASANAIQYDILRNGQPWKTVPSNVLATFDDQVISTTSYTYAVTSLNNDGNTDSTPASITLIAV